MEKGRLTGDESPSNRRLTVPEAAGELGITEAAVRGRIKRGTLRSLRESGTVFVLPEGASPSFNRDEPTDQPSDQSELITVLREQLAAEREANRENRRIIAALASRIPEIEAPQERQESPQERAEASGGVEGGAAAGGPQAAPRRPWWRRVFGG